MNSKTQYTVTTSCRGETEKILLPDGLCALFLTQLSVALPAHDFVETDTGQNASLTLTVIKVSSSSLVARIDQPDQVGDPLGIARADAPLDGIALAQFLDRLIASILQP